VYSIGTIFPGSGRANWGRGVYSAIFYSRTQLQESNGVQHEESTRVLCVHGTDGLFTGTVRASRRNACRDRAGVCATLRCDDRALPERMARPWDAVNIIDGDSDVYDDGGGDTVARHGSSFARSVAVVMVIGLSLGLGLGLGLKPASSSDETIAPTAAPTLSPTAAPTAAPTLSPTAAPTAAPTASFEARLASFWNSFVTGNTSVPAGATYGNYSAYTVQATATADASLELATQSDAYALRVPANGLYFEYSLWFQRDGSYSEHFISVGVGEVNDTLIAPAVADLQGLFANDTATRLYRITLQSVGSAFERASTITPSLAWTGLGSQGDSEMTFGVSILADGSHRLKLVAGGSGTWTSAAGVFTVPTPTGRRVALRLHVRTLANGQQMRLSVNFGQSAFVDSASATGLGTL